MSFIAVFIWSFVLWLVLTAGSKGLLWSPEELIAGLIFSGIIALTTKNIIGERAGRFLNPAKWVGFIVYAIGPLFWGMAKANLDVAYRVLHPARPIRPGIVKCKTVLNSDTGKLSLANSITLTPGTITLDVDNDEYFIHWIWVPDEVLNAKDDSEHVEKASEAITRPFEKFLKVIFG